MYDFLHFIAIGVAHDLGFLQQDGPAAQRTDDDEAHHDHDQHAQRGKQVLLGGDVLVHDQPDARPEGDEGHEDAGGGGDPRVLGLVHAQQHGRADEQRHRGEELVADAEQGPDAGNVAGVDEIAPRAREQEAGHDDAGPPVLVAELGDDLADHFLQEETANAGAGVHGGQDEYRFKHDGEVVPVAHEVGHQTMVRSTIH